MTQHQIGGGKLNVALANAFTGRKMWMFLNSKINSKKLFFVGEALDDLIAAR
jgi:hypothetical protein